MRFIGSRAVTYGPGIDRTTIAIALPAQIVEIFYNHRQLPSDEVDQ